MTRDKMPAAQPFSSPPPNTCYTATMVFRLIAPTPSAPAVDLGIGPIGHALRPHRREPMYLIPASIVLSSQDAKGCAATAHRSPVS